MQKHCNTSWTLLLQILTEQFIFCPSSALSLEFKCILYINNSKLQKNVPYICSNINSKKYYVFFPQLTHIYRADSETGFWCAFDFITGEYHDLCNV